MVKTASQSCMNWEPIELRILKRQLANITCKCTLCERYKFFKNYHTRAKCEKEVQVSQSIKRSDKCNQMSPFLYAENIIHPRGKNSLCTNCLLTMNILARREMKTLKDEETETNKHIHCETCNRCMTKYVTSASKVTSSANSSPRAYSNFTISDFISQCSSDAAVPSKHTKRSDNENMKLIGYGIHNERGRYRNYMHGNCLYLDDYVDSIRPPLE